GSTRFGIVLYVSRARIRRRASRRTIPMLAYIRAGFVAALVTLAPTVVSVSPAFAANKLFERSDLKEAGLKLEAEIKQEADRSTKPAAQLRREADAAFQRGDTRNGMVLLSELV